MNDVLTKTVGRLVVERPGRSRVFERYQIDYCCGGKKRLADACEDAGVSADELVAALAEVEGEDKANAEQDWSSATLGALIDHILSAHHAYLRRELPRLSDLATRVVRAHGDRHEWVRTGEQVLSALRTELESHMMKEEQMLFPMIRELETAVAPPAFHCGALRNPIGVMEHEHDSAGSALARLRELSKGYTPPADACNTFRAWLDGLAELERDLHEHIHEENNVLFPRAEDREAQLTRA